MTKDIEGDVRTMLRRRAGNVRVTDDAWDAIAARLGEPRRAVRRSVAFVGAAVAAAVLAMAIFVARQHDTGVPVTSLPQRASVQLPPHVWEGEPGQDAGTVIEAYVKYRTGVAVTTANYEGSNDEVRATFLRRDVATEVFGRKVGDRWLVISAASDLVPIDNPSYDGTMSTAVITPATDGELQLAFGDRFAAWDSPHDVTAQESVPARSAGHVSIRALLRTSDGTIGLSEVMPVLSPLPEARRYLDEELGLADAEIGLNDFQQGDPTSGEIPYVIVGGGTGTIFVRQSANGAWSVTGITSDTLHLHLERVDGGLAVSVAELEADAVTVTGLADGDSADTVVAPGHTAMLHERPGYPLRRVIAIARTGDRVVAVADVAVD